jgi:hypothetical protein
MAWDGSISYNSSATYTCGPYGNFQAKPGGPLYEEQVIVCSWNKSWTPEVIPQCVATSCPSVPFPPSSSGMIYRPDAKNNITLNTGENKREIVGMKLKISLCFLTSLRPGWLSVALCFVGEPTFECGEGTWLNCLLLFSLSQTAIKIFLLVIFYPFLCSQFQVWT